MFNDIHEKIKNQKNKKYVFIKNKKIKKQKINKYIKKIKSKKLK